MNKLIKPDFDIKIKKLLFLGRGPSAIGVFVSGWNRSEKIIYKCVKCGSEMNGSHDDYWNCECGAVNLDYDNGRFGSSYGDQNILVYLIMTRSKHYFLKALIRLRINLFGVKY